jgi:hypothetical protein
LLPTMVLTTFRTSKSKASTDISNRKATNIRLKRLQCSTLVIPHLEETMSWMVFSDIKLTEEAPLLLDIKTV